MATSPNPLPNHSTIDQEAIDSHLLAVQAAMMNQIAQATLGRLVLDDVLHCIARQLQEALSVSGCLIVQLDDTQGREGGSDREHSLASRWVKVATTQPNSEVVPFDRLYRLFCNVYQSSHSWLAQGKSVGFPGAGQQISPVIQNSAKESGLWGLLMVPLLHSSFDLGAIILYQCEPQREWTYQEIAFVQAIADQCAIALFVAALEQRAKHTQSALQASVDRNRALLEVIPDAIFRVTRDGIYLDGKAAKQDTLSASTTEIMGRHLHQVLPTEVAGLIWHHVELAIETHEMQLVEYHLWVNGKSHHFEARIIKSGADEVAVIVQDITERVEVRVALEQLNDALEIRVAERTAALREANRILRAEIIERHRAQEQLKESEERFRNLVETSSDWVWEVNENAVYTYASPKVESVLGYKASDVLGKTTFDFMPPQERQRVADLFAQLSTSRQPFTCVENTTIHKDGHLVVLERSGVPIFDAKGIFCGYRGIDRDITERKKSEKEVQFLHSITRAIFESQDFYAALSVALQKVCEATGWDFGEAWVPRADGTVLECSPAWFSKTKNLETFRRASETLTFAPHEGLPGRVWSRQKPEWRRDVSAESNQIYLRAQLAREAGLKAALGIPLLTTDGVLAVLIFYMFESKDEDQRLIELIAASTELGLMIQRKQAEGEIRKALEKEKELRELKSRFITMTSHEFRTPLTTIHSSAELLENYGHKWTQEKKLTHLKRIQTSVKHMTRLLNDVLILGKVEAEKLKLNPVPLDLEKFCHNLVEELQLNDNNQHTIIFTCDWGLGMEKGRGSMGERGTGALVRTGERENFSSQSPQEQHTLFSSLSQPYMDEKLLRQILENLLSNAIKYSPNGSTIDLTISALEEQAIFQIRDRGIGIPSEDQPRLFETFHRSTNVGTIAGTGLGLAIVKKCVDIHQGQIAVESEIGVGTTFTVTLPIYNLEHIGTSS
ncbi:PAS domain S-box protein [Allocoleopsis sp.]|uniref:PAS domain S-box protein n=1 Tax=Allocoleopsis sp. TaxID=3088169 RepID=UPI002FD0EC9E